MIKNMTHTDLIEEDFQWGEHVWFPIPLEGVQYALEAHDGDGGYGWLYYLFADLEWLDVSDFPAHPNGNGDPAAIGDMVHWTDDERRIVWHGIYTHSVDRGYHHEYYATDRITPKLDTWWEDNEANIVWPMRVLRFGAGARHHRLHERVLSGREPDVNLMLMPLAKTEAEFAIYWMD